MSLEERVKSLEQWRDSVAQACFQAPKKDVPQAPSALGTQQALLNNFPEELAEIINVSDMGGEWRITKTLDRSDEGKRAFARICSIVEQLGGTWNPAGKDSHWIVPK